MGRVATAQGKRNLFLLFPDGENPGNFVVTQGKFFDYIHYCKKHVSLHIFSNFFIYILFLPVYLLSYFLSISHWLQVSTKLLWALLKTNWNNVMWNMYIQEIFFNITCFKHFNQKVGNVLLSMEFDMARCFCSSNSDQNCITKLYQIV